MAKQQWPATVKVAWNEVKSPTEDGYVSFDTLEVGQGQVAVLLALQYAITNGDTESDRSAKLWLYRHTQPSTKSDAWKNETQWAQDTNVIDHASGVIATRSTDAGYKVYPYPIVLIRQPSIIYSGVGAGSVIFQVGLWYVLQNVTDKEMTELMVKDHA